MDHGSLFRTLFCWTVQHNIVLALFCRIMRPLAVLVTGVLRSTCVLLAEGKTSLRRRLQHDFDFAATSPIDWWLFQQDDIPIRDSMFKGLVEGKLLKPKTLELMQEWVTDDNGNKRGQ